MLRKGAREPQRLDVLIENGRIAALATPPHGLPARPGASTVDLAGKLIVPGLLDAHQHLDKSRTRRAVRNPSGTLDGALAGYRDFAATVTRADMIARAERTIAHCAAYGTVAIRSHTNVDPPTQVRGIEAMVEVRERCADRMTVQVVAHVTSDATRMREAARLWLEEAVKLGADVIGGVPAFSDDPVAFLDMVFDVADRSGLPLDLHVDEHLNASALLFSPLIERTRALGMHGRVTASHSCALSALGVEDAKPLIEGLAEAGIAVIALPAANLFLQGREAAVPPRGLTRVSELLSAGVVVAAGSDNIQDPFVPTGSGDLLEIARWTLLAGHFGLNDLAAAFDMVTRAPAAIMGLEGEWGIIEGARADLLITDAEDAQDLVASGAAARTVLVGGRVVAGSLPHQRPG